MNAFGFVEVVSQVAPSESEWIECYLIKDIDPRMCGTLVRDLNAVLPLRGRTNDDSSFVVGLLDYAAEKIVVCRRHPVVKHRGVIHVVFQHCQTIVLSLVNLAE